MNSANCAVSCVRPAKRPYGNEKVVKILEIRDLKMVKEDIGNCNNFLQFTHDECK